VGAWAGGRCKCGGTVAGKQVGEVGAVGQAYLDEQEATAGLMEGGGVGQGVDLIGGELGKQVAGGQGAGVGSALIEVS
jgi:hypothetical protein